MAVFYLCLCASHAYAQMMITVRVADFAPNYFKDDAGRWTGLDVELAEAIITAAGFEPKFEVLPWSRAMNYMKEGNIQYMTNLYKTDERSEFMYWIGPVRVEDMGLIVHKDNISLPINSLDDLVNVTRLYHRRFGIQQDIVYPDNVMQRMNENPEFKNCFESVSEVDHNLRKTEYKRILGFFESVPGMRYRLHTDPEFRDLTVHPFVLKKEEVYHGVSMAGVSSDMIKKFQDGYSRCVADGTIQRILEKWQVQ